VHIEDVIIKRLYNNLTRGKRLPYFLESMRQVIFIYPL
jgi:hypothetical protein